MIYISTIEQLQLIGNDPGYLLSDDYELTGNIDASVTSGWDGGKGFLSIGYTSPFTGTFDGKGYSITGLYINRGARGVGSTSVPAYLGLFGHAQGANIKNVNIVDCDFTMTETIIAGTWPILMAPLAAYITDETVIDNCNISGELKSQLTMSGGGGFGSYCNGSGLACFIYDSTVTNCSVNCNFSVIHTVKDYYFYCAGFCMETNSGTIINNCSASGNLESAYGATGFCDGNYGGTIRNCTYNGTDCTIETQDGAGFCWINEGTIEDCQVIFESFTFVFPSWSDDVGFCWLNLGTIEDCHVTGDFIATGDGAAFCYENGDARDPIAGTITNCSFTGNFTSGSQGGFLYLNDMGTIYGCKFIGNSIVHLYTGAFLPWNEEDGIIEKCYFQGSFTIIDFYGGCNGFLLENDGIVRNCYTQVDFIISGDLTPAIRGFVGYNYSEIVNCYSVILSITGRGTPSSEDGFCYSNDSTITSCYWDTETSGILTSDGGTGKTTAEMKKQATFIDWNFDTIWYVEEDVIYPIFDFPPPASVPGFYHNNGIVSMDITGCALDASNQHFHTLQLNTLRGYINSSCIVDNNLVLKKGCVSYGNQDVFVHLKKDMTYGALYNEQGECNNLSLVLEGTGKQIIHNELGGILPTLIQDQTTSVKVLGKETVYTICEGDTPILIRGSFLLEHGTFDMNKHDIQVGLY